MRAASLSLVLAFSSCGGEPEPTRPEPPTTETAAPEPTHVGDTVPAPSTAEPAMVPSAVVPSDPPNVAFVATPGTSGVAMSIANHGTADVSLRTSVVIEGESNGTFAASSSPASLSLRYDCEHEAARCVTLAPGAELLPPDWLGMLGDAQCACEHCVPVEAGDYRLVVTTCDGAHRVESNTFAR